jgi:hypothetical protein
MDFVLGKRIIVGLIMFLVLQAKTTLAEEFMQLPGVIHVYSTFSSGKYSIEKLVSKAKTKGLEVIILTDHDLVRMEYGIPPLRNLIKKKEERKSIIKIGPEKYLAEIKRQNRRQADVIVIPGVQSSPFYYWTGSPFKKNLTAHDYRKELLLIGMQDAEDYRQLPILHNGFSNRYFKDLLPRNILFLAAFLFGLYLLSHKKIYKIIGSFVAGFSILLLFNNHPFQSSRFDPYHGDQAIAPYQEVIDYVGQRNGLTFWAHPESNYSAAGVRMGSAKLMTKHYPEDFIIARGYTGFSSIYGDTITATDPGKHWDQVLGQYCAGLRATPIWGIAGADFHVEKNGVDLDTFQTIFMVNSKTVAEVLRALSNGRFYAVRKSNQPRLSLERFQITDPTTGKKVTMGAGLKVTSIPLVEGKVSASDNKRIWVKVSVVRDGKLWQTFEGQTPLEFHLADTDKWTGKTFYRVDIRSGTFGRLLSNPIFVTKSK